jgi:hypothetical protein
MSNISVYLPLVDGGLLPVVDKGQSSKTTVQTLYSDDFEAPPHSLNIEITTDSGKLVKVIIPYDNSKAIVLVDGDRI